MWDSTIDRIPSDLRLPGKREVYFWLPRHHDLRQRMPRSTGVCPAERAVAGVEVQVADLAASDVRHVRRRSRPQPRPELRAARVGGAGEELLHAPHDRLAAHAVERAAVAAELRGAGDAQAVAQAREHQLVLV